MCKFPSNPHVTPRPQAPKPLSPPPPTTRNHINVSTEAGSSQGQAAAFFRLLNRHEKPPLSWQGIQATQIDRVSYRIAHFRPEGGPRQPPGGNCISAWGQGGVGGRSLIYLSRVLTLKHTEGYLNVNI